jgi:hypothetical protein
MVVFCGHAFAQAGIDTGGVTGTVKDSAGAVVVGARCTLVNQGTGVIQDAVTTSAGAYTFPLVKIGTYTLKVNAKGFGQFQIDDIAVHLGSTVTEDVPLKVGAASASITVTSTAPLLQAQDASLGMTVDGDEIDDPFLAVAADGISWSWPRSQQGSSSLAAP